MANKNAAPPPPHGPTLDNTPAPLIVVEQVVEDQKRGLVPDCLVDALEQPRRRRVADVVRVLARLQVELIVAPRREALVVEVKQALRGEREVGKLLL